ncbi:MAG: DUF4365 domain-containing protein [Eubacteriales bacterium]
MPKRTEQNQKGSSGQSYIQFFVENILKWIYHPVNQNNDFGIDGYIEIVENGYATSKLLAIQVKHGDTYFKKKNIGSYTFYGEDKHLNYYLNNRCPVIIIIVDNDFCRKNWKIFDIELTSPESNGWSIEIPEVNMLDQHVSAVWKKIGGPVIDFTEEIKYAWEIEKKYSEVDLFMFSISKEEVEACSFDSYLRFIKRLTKNEKMLLRMHSCIELFFPDYQNDSRELFEIPEVINWFSTAIRDKIPLSYFLSYDIKSYSILLISYSQNMKYLKEIQKTNGKIYIHYEKEAFINLLEQILDNLNNFCDEHPVAETLNEEISYGLYNMLIKQFSMEDVLPEINK